MKKIKSTFLMLITLVSIMSVSACKKCQTCTFQGDSEEIYQDDFDNKDQYEATIELAEAFGATCK